MKIRCRVVWHKAIAWARRTPQVPKNRFVDAEELIDQRCEVRGNALL
jgi:hypothetical protein